MSKNNNLPETEDYGNDIVTLVDEDGNENEFEIVSAEFERIPNDFKEVTAEQREVLDKLLDKFEEDEDVQNVFHNIKEDAE